MDIHKNSQACVRQKNTIQNKSDLWILSKCRCNKRNNFWAQPWDFTWQKSPNILSWNIGFNLCLQDNYYVWGGSNIVSNSATPNYRCVLEHSTNVTTVGSHYFNRTMWIKYLYFFSYIRFGGDGWKIATFLLNMDLPWMTRLTRPFQALHYGVLLLEMHFSLDISFSFSFSLVEARGFGAFEV